MKLFSDATRIYFKIDLEARVNRTRSKMPGIQFYLKLLFASRSPTPPQTRLNDVIQSGKKYITFIGSLDHTV